VSACPPQEGSPPQEGGFPGWGFSRMGSRGFLPRDCDLRGDVFLLTFYVLRFTFLVPACLPPEGSLPQEGGFPGWGFSRRGARGACLPQEGSPPQEGALPKWGSPALRSLQGPGWGPAVLACPKRVGRPRRVVFPDGARLPCVLCRVPDGVPYCFSTRLWLNLLPSAFPLFCSSKPPFVCKNNPEYAKNNPFFWHINSNRI
jgi:hypothetical protein